MPVKSAKQLRLFEAVAHSKKVSKKTGIPQSTARQYLRDTPKSTRKRLARSK